MEEDKKCPYCHQSLEARHTNQVVFRSGKGRRRTTSCPICNWDNLMESEKLKYSHIRDKYIWIIPSQEEAEKFITRERLDRLIETTSKVVTDEGIEELREILSGVKLDNGETYGRKD